MDLGYRWLLLIPVSLMSDHKLSQGAYQLIWKVRRLN